MLVNGQWEKAWDPIQKSDKEGRFIRQTSAFRAGVGEEMLADMYLKNGSPRFCLYVAYICPWATRALIARTLLNLDKVIDVRVVTPVLTDQGWAFGDFEDSHTVAQAGVEYMHQLYTQADPNFTGRATVPVLWDRKHQTIINNESADILRILNEDFRPVHQSDINLAPKAELEAIDQFNARIYDALNNGVYRAGFASSQAAYQEAFDDVFTCLDELEEHFSVHDYAVNDHLTEADIRLFVTLVRFDLAYYSLFKTNRQLIEQYPALSAYLDRLLSISAFSEHTKPTHIKAGYYSIKALNPTGFVPAGPELSWFKHLL